jgi:integrase
MTLSKLAREQGIKSTVHGFRSSFRTWCQEKTNVQAEVAEAALAHVKADKVEAAYARSDLFEKRTQLMESWANFLSNRPAEIVPLRAG